MLSMLIIKISNTSRSISKQFFLRSSAGVAPLLSLFNENILNGNYLDCNTVFANECSNWIKWLFDTLALTCENLSQVFVVAVPSIVMRQRNKICLNAKLCERCLKVCALARIK